MNARVTVYFFYAFDCPHCKATEPFIDGLEKKYPQVTFTRLEVSGNSDNMALYNDNMERYHATPRQVPAVFVGDDALVGEPAIKGGLESIIVSMLKDNVEPAPTVAGAPTSLLAAAGDGQARLTWKAPTMNGGTTIDYYVVYQNGKDTSHVEGTSYTANGLSNGVKYGFAVAAHNGAGIGPKSNVVSVSPSSNTIAPTIVAPGPPVDLMATADDGQVDLSWAPPADDGGSTVTSYQLSWYTNTSGAVDTRTINGTTFRHEGLENGLTYHYKVAAINAVGVSEPSGAVDATPTAPPLPPAPMGLNASIVNGSVSLIWNAPADGVLNVTGYNIYRGDNGSTAELVASTAGTSYVDGDVQSNQTYYYQVISLSNGDRPGPVGDVVISTVNDAAPSSTPSSEITQAQMVIVGLSLSAIAIIGFSLWSSRRP